MGADASIFACAEKLRQRHPPVRPEERLRRLDHELHAEGAGGEPMAALERVEERHQERRLLRSGDLGQRDHEVARQDATGTRQELVDEELQRPRRASLPFLAERLDPNADERRKQAFGHRARRLLGRAHRRRVLFGVGTRAEPILEVDAEILDRLAFELLLHALVDDRDQPFAVRPRGKREADGLREVGRVSSVSRHRATRAFAEARHRLRAKQLRAAVDGVHRLPRGAVARIEHVQLADWLR